MGPQSSAAPPVEAAARWLRALPAAVEPLWVCGLLLLQVVWAGAALPLSGKRLEWAQYLLLGLLFPALLAAAGVAGRLRQAAASAAAAAQGRTGRWMPSPRLGLPP